MRLNANCDLKVCDFGLARSFRTGVVGHGNWIHDRIRCDALVPCPRDHAYLTQHTKVRLPNSYGSLVISRVMQYVESELYLV